MYDYLARVHRAKEQIGFALALVLIGIAIKFAVTASFGFGPDDVQRFEAAPFGAPVAENTPAVFLTWSRGDGMAFYALASDLDANGPASALPPDPAYRMTRIGYSVAVRTASLIPGVSVAAALTLVNLTALGVLGAIAPRLTSIYGERALLLYLNPAIWYAVAFDTAEAMGMCFLLVTMAYSGAGVWVSAALLGITRPSMAVALPSSRSPTVATVLAVGSAVGLQLWIYSAGIGPTDGAGNLTVPLLGYWLALPEMTGVAIGIAAAVLVGSMAAVYLASARTHLRTGLRVSLLAAGVLALALAPQVVDRPENLLRATAALPVVLVLGFSRSGHSDGSA